VIDLISREEYFRFLGISYSAMYEKQENWHPPSRGDAQPHLFKIARTIGKTKAGREKISDDGYG
jgi:hypothetical protein